MPFSLPILDVFSRRPIKYTPMGIYVLYGARTRLYAPLAILAHYHGRHFSRMCYTMIVRKTDGHN